MVPAWGRRKQLGARRALSALQRPPYSPEQGDFRTLPPALQAPRWPQL